MVKRKSQVLTLKQQETLKALSDFIAEKHYSPSCQELADILGLKFSSLYNRLEGLIAKGYVARDSCSRSLRIIREPDWPRSRLVSIPLVGTVAAGMPILAEENIEGHIFLETSIPHPENCFAVRAMGESMKEAGIKTGDILIVRQQRLALDGEIVIASVNGETTVKTLRFNNSNVVLVPENKTMKPIPISEEDDFRIQGIVVLWKSVG